ncbi:MAG TPA: endonuclease/exonuclease/phosphatase family protein [Thermosynergistes sp.]|nr:endonuclease/exonuclease/phosphatase family protein [Thermosynergistes sp.]
MRLVLYNVRYGTGTGWDYHLPFPFWGCFRKTEDRFWEISDFIAKLNPDIVGLVESDGGSYRQNGASQPAIVASQIGGLPVFACKYYGNSFIAKAPVLRFQGNAVVTKVPPVTYRRRYLSRGMKRAVLEIEYPDFVLFLVHLSLGPGARKAQLEELKARCAEAKKPVILAGDGNTFGGAKELAPLMEAVSLRNANAADMPTFPSSYPSFALDFVLYSPGIEVQNFFMPRVSFSDHLPLVCDFSVQKTELTGNAIYATGSIAV